MPSNFFLPIPGTFSRLAGGLNGPWASRKATIRSASLGPTPFRAQSSSAVAVLISRGKRTAGFFARGFRGSPAARVFITLSATSGASAAGAGAYSTLEYEAGASSGRERSEISTVSIDGGHPHYEKSHGNVQNFPFCCVHPVPSPGRKLVCSFYYVFLSRASTAAASAGTSTETDG